ncbi:MAG: SLC13 family permease [Planctomycetota bacterium]
MKVAVLIVFALTYALIVSRRLHWLPLGRSAGALLGAVAMVAIGALSPRESYAAVDHDTIVLLLGMMLVAAYLERGGFFGRAAGLLTRVCRTPGRLLLGVGVGAAALSALLVNDTVCLFLTPIVVAACLRHGLPLAPYLLAVATSANIGSAATLVGNPQNMLIGSLSQVPFATFLLVAAPAVLLGLALNLALLWLMFGRHLPTGELAAVEEGAPADTPPNDGPGAALSAAVLLGISAGFLCGLHLGYTALAGALAFMVASRREPQEAFARVDWQLLVFFAGLFVVVAALQRTGLVAEAYAALAPRLDLTRPGGVLTFTAAMTLGANTVSNVPLVLLLGERVASLGGSPVVAWVLLGFVTTVAGNLTLIGSVANIIVVEGAREHYDLGFWEYLRFGGVSTVLVLAAGVPLLMAWGAWLGA